MTKQNAIELAQRTANRDNHPMAVLNLNPFGSLYVVRDWHDDLAGNRQLVARVEPMRGPQ
jgi:hypothetical protein